GQSLVTTDGLGQRDGTPPETVRIYHFAGTQHAATATMPKGVCTTPYNIVDNRPLQRAALVALDRWVKDGTPPPPSRHPRLADSHRHRLGGAQRVRRRRRRAVLSRRLLPAVRQDQGGARGERRHAPLARGALSRSGRLRRKSARRRRGAAEAGLHAGRGRGAHQRAGLIGGVVIGRTPCGAGRRSWSARWA